MPTAMFRRWGPTLAVALVLDCLHPSHAQTPATQPVPSVSAAGLVATTLRLDDLAGETCALTAAYPAVVLASLLALVGASQGLAIHGKALAVALVAEAADGYRVVFASPAPDAALARRVGALPNHCAPRKVSHPLDAAGAAPALGAGAGVACRCFC